MHEGADAITREEEDVAAKKKRRLQQTATFHQEAMLKSLHQPLACQEDPCRGAARFAGRNQKGSRNSDLSGRPAQWCVT